MIEVEKTKGKYDCCNSCRSKEGVLEIRIRASKDVNANSICLCSRCIEAIREKAIQIGKQGKKEDAQNEKI